MELLLNLAWILLAVPAFWLWRYSRTIAGSRNATPLQGLLALGCLLVFLFPVISLTDDLGVMRNFMEEPPTAKRQLRHANNGKTTVVRKQHPPALIAGADFLTMFAYTWADRPIFTVSKPHSSAIQRPGRAPPALFA